MKQWKFEFDINPITKDNVKIMSRSGRFFLPRKYKDFEHEIKGQFIAQQPADFQIFTGQLAVEISFYFKDNRRRDLLNYPKSFCDALNGLCWVDDSQIYIANLLKLKSEKPHITLTVMEVGNGELVPLIADMSKWRFMVGSNEERKL